MTKGKDFSNRLQQSVSNRTEEKKTEPAELEPVPEKKEYVKIVLRMEKDLHAALQSEARKIAAAEDRKYSLTELINDILKSYRNTEG